MTLPLAQQQILKVLSDGRLHSYRDIVLGTGKYSNLPAELRERHPRSLGSKGFVREVVLDIEGVKVDVFQITLAGLKELDGIRFGKSFSPPKLLGNLEEATADFLKRYEAFRKDYQKEEAAAKKCGLRRNSYMLLLALADGQPHVYADLARATGIFSGLPQDLRARHGNHKSLGSLGLVKETVVMGDERDKHAFQITAKGLKTLDKAK